MVDQHTRSLMQVVADMIRSREIRTPEGTFLVTVHREDCSGVYPGMIRYTVRIRAGDRVLSLFSTNSYEYTPLMPLEAERVALALAGRWEQELMTSPRELLSRLPALAEPPVSRIPSMPVWPAGGSPEVVIIQGSPRPDGNCGIMAGWVASAAREARSTVRVFYPHDMDIRPCTGCYQCYNAGTCAIDDQMTHVIRALRGALLVVVCSPVYTNTVPGGLKNLIDRSLAYNAERHLSGATHHPAGLLLAAAGRMGEEHFTCVRSVVYAFMGSCGIRKGGEVLVDDLDMHRDVRALPGIREQVTELVRTSLLPHD